MKIFILTLAAVLLIAAGCGKSAVETDDAGGPVKISLGSTNLFKGDLSRVTGWDALKTLRDLGRAGLDSAEPQKALLKAAAQISFDEAKVMVIAFDEDKLMQIAEADFSEIMCDWLYTNYQAFEGKDLYDWDDLLDGAKQSYMFDVTYSGSLAKSGNEVTGDVIIKAGVNYVVIGFISGGRVTWTEQAVYVYLSRVLGGESYGEDGWVTDSAELQAGAASAIWMDYKHQAWMSEQDLYWGLNPADSIFVLFPLGFPTGYLGMSEALADTLCNYYRTYYVNPY